MSSKRSTGAERSIKYLTQEQIRDLMRAAKKASQRDRLLLAFLYRFGMRASEVCGLHAEAVDAKRREIRIRGLKSGLERVYTIPQDVRGLMRGYKPDGEYYFSSRQGERMARTRLWQIVKGFMESAGLPAWATIHSLRHSLAVHMLDAGLQLEDVRDQLRHKRIASTDVYGAISTRRRNDYLSRMEQSAAVVKLP
jgi:site-specific recombinase XerD